MRISFEVPEDVLHQLLDPVSIPDVVEVSYDMPTPEPVRDFDRCVREEVLRVAEQTGISSGQRIAVGVGSRGIGKLDQIVTALVAALRSVGAEPFIVPAMGSHGGATDTGQERVLAELGVTEKRVGAAIRSSMSTVTVGETDDGVPVRIDRLAMESDGIVLVARVKPHTAFRGQYESGLAKMIAIGLGKQRGAAATHARGFSQMGRMVPAMARVALANAPIRFGLAIIENADDLPCRILAVPAERILAEEPGLLEQARRAMPGLPFQQIDVLVIDTIGKNISGDGADPNITGRYPTPDVSGGPDVNKQVVLDLAPASGGNANGVGTADFTTARLAARIDLGQTYPNSLTSTVPGPVKIPMILPSDRLALAAALLTCHAVDRPPRLIRIRNTLQLHRFWISEALLDEAREELQLHLHGPPAPFPFDRAGNLMDLASSTDEPTPVHRAGG